MFHSVCVFKIIHNVFKLIFASPDLAASTADFTFLVDEQERLGIAIAVTSVTILIQ
jgi:hypothetical protein